MHRLQCPPKSTAKLSLDSALHCVARFHCAAWSYCAAGSYCAVCSFALAIAFASLARPASAADAAESLAKVAAADGTAQVDGAAAEASKSIQGLPSAQVTEVLAAFEKSTKRGKNWLRSLAADVCDNGPFPEDDLVAFFNDRSNDGDARYVAFQLLIQNEPDSRGRLLAKGESDPSLPVRYLKIRSMIKNASKLIADQPDQAKEILRSVIANGRSPQQLEEATKLLGDLDVEIDLANELGMMREWWLCGPFDNTDTQHFDTAYPPESRYQEVGLPYAREAGGDPKPEEGKDGPANWRRIASDDSLGMVDLNEPLSNEKDAAAYVYARFTLQDSNAAGNAEVRLGCITANKIWINGKLVSSSDVYHSGTRIDQYVDPCELVDGVNTVLIKVMQNAQTEPWAQDWQFQFRLTRPDGSAIKTTSAE